MSEWEVTCRVCLEGGDMVSLFDTDENNELLRDKYKYTTDIEVLESDPLPQLICLTCVDRLMFAYQFKQQCITSNETLKECLAEINKTSASIPADARGAEGTELITIKQENGVFLQYELPVEREGAIRSVLTSAPPRKHRGRPRKYPNEMGEIEKSPYNRKTERTPKKPDERSLSEFLASGGLDGLKEEPGEEELSDNGDEALDSDYEPEKVETSTTPVSKKQPKKSKGRRLKKTDSEPSEDLLLKETIMAYNEPITPVVIKTKPKKPKEYRKRNPSMKIHTCETCGNSFGSNAALQVHVRRHLGIKPFVCRYVFVLYCGRFLYSYTCETCGNSFKSNHTLQAHIRRHLGIKPFVCSVCGYACVLNMELRRHMLRHTGVRPYKCRICERRFGDFGSRQKHERLHLGERPYVCSLCGKAFTYSYVLTNHMLTHTGEKKFGCEPCNKRFTKSHHLKYHNKVHHKDLYLQQQREAEQKKLKEQYRMAEYSAMMAGQLLEGHIIEGQTVQLLQANEGELVEAEVMSGQMQIVEAEQMDADELEEAERMSEHTHTYLEVENVKPDMPDIQGNMHIQTSEGELIVGDMQPHFKLKESDDENEDEE